MSTLPRRPRADDAVRLEPDALALHQSLAYEAPAETWASALGGSLLFRTFATPGGFTALWTRATADSESLRGPLATVRTIGGACLLEAWSQDRLKRLQRTLVEVAGAAVSTDLTFVADLEEALAHPEHLLETRAGAAPRTRQEIAAAYVRGAWGFVTRAELHGRLPVFAARTGRGRDAIAEIADAAQREILVAAPSFPMLSSEQWRALFERDAAAATAPLEPRAIRRE